MIKRLLAVGLCLLLVLFQGGTALADEIDVDLKLDEDLPEAVQVISLADDSIPAKSAILMDQQSGRVLFEQNADEPLAPASITKIMTLLLVVEALEEGKISLEDKVAPKFGWSQERR